MAATVTVNILGDARSGVRAADQAGGAFNRLGRNADGSDRSVRKLGRGVSFLGASLKTLGVGLAVGGVLRLGQSVVKAASDVQQSFGAIDAVFGKNADVVKAWARSAANDVGLAKSEYAQLATVLGASLKNTGIKEFTGQTADLIVKGADLAAQFGGSTKEAIEAISSLLRGELDPIERYGVSIKQSTINAELAAKGLDKLTGAARTQAEQQVRLKLLNDQTASSYKAFSRESDTLANQQQKLGANWENLKAFLGERFLPVATKLTKWLVDTVTGHNQTSAAIQKTGSVLGSFLQPIIEGAVAGWHHINDSVNEATGSSTGMHDILVKIGKAAEKYAPIVGKKLGDAVEETGTRIGVAIEFAVDFWHALKKIGEFADKALGPLDELIGKLGKIDGLTGVLSGALNPLGQLAGLFSSGVALPGGLGRAGGIGALGGGSGSAIHLTTRPQFNLVVDVPALRDFIRLEARNEVSRQVVAARSTR